MNFDEYLLARVHSSSNNQLSYSACEEISRRCAGMGRTAFRKCCERAYQTAKRNGWIDSFTWLGVKDNPHTGRMYSVYRYVFSDFGCSYVGLTIDADRRDYEHHNGRHGKKSAVLKFAEANGIEVPKMEILRSGMTCVEAQDAEHQAAIDEIGRGMRLLNSKATGVGVGSLGGVARKWSKARVFEASKKFSSTSSFNKAHHGAYEVARKRGWLSNMPWLYERKMNRKLVPANDSNNGSVRVTFSDDVVNYAILNKNRHDIMSATAFRAFLEETGRMPKSARAAEKCIAFNGSEYLEFDSFAAAGRALGIRKHKVREAAKGIIGSYGGWVFSTNLDSGEDTREALRRKFSEFDEHGRRKTCAVRAMKDGFVLEFSSWSEFSRYCGCSRPEDARKAFMQRKQRTFHGFELVSVEHKEAS